MAKPYRHTGFKRFGNGLLTRVVRGGGGPEGFRLVTVRGRKSGREYSTPFFLVERPEGRYWVSLFGETNTVKNARAAGQVTVSRGGAREGVRLVEVPAEDRLPPLRAYLEGNKNSMVRKYFATPGSSDEELQALAPEHPVFKLEPA